MASSDDRICHGRLQYFGEELNHLKRTTFQEYNYTITSPFIPYSCAIFAQLWAALTESVDEKYIPHHFGALCSVPIDYIDISAIRVFFWFLQHWEALTSRRLDPWGPGAAAALDRVDPELRKAFHKFEKECGADRFLEMPAIFTEELLKVGPLDLSNELVTVQHYHSGLIYGLLKPGLFDKAVHFTKSMMSIWKDLDVERKAPLMEVWEKCHLDPSKVELGKEWDKTSAKRIPRSRCENFAELQARLGKLERTAGVYARGAVKCFVDGSKSVQFRPFGVDGML